MQASETDVSELLDLAGVRKLHNVPLMQADANDLIDQISSYLAASGMKPTRFGKLVNNDPSLVAGLLSGRDPRRSTVRKIMDFIAANPAPRTQEAAE